jgi:hypothetical protein
MDVDELDVQSAPNHGLTLREARKNFRKFGASEESMLEHVLPEKDRRFYEYRPRDIGIR